MTLSPIVFWMLLFVIPTLVWVLLIIVSERRTKFGNKDQSLLDMIKGNIGIMSLAGSVLSLIICGIVWIISLFYHFPTIYTVTPKNDVSKEYVIWRGRSHSQYEHNRFYLCNHTSEPLAEVSFSYGPSHIATDDPIKLINIIEPNHTIELSCDPISVMSEPPKYISVKKTCYQRVKILNKGFVLFQKSSIVRQWRIYEEMKTIQYEISCLNAKNNTEEAAIGIHS